MKTADLFFKKFKVVFVMVIGFIRVPKVAKIDRFFVVLINNTF